MTKIKENNIDYIIINGLLHNDKDFNKIVDKYINATHNNIIEKENNFTGFLFKESIYKVK